MVVQALKEGLIFGADRNITTTSVKQMNNGQIIYTVCGQSQRRKVLRWPNNKALIGYVGVAALAGIPTDEWLYDFIGRNLSFTDFGELAVRLRDEVQAQRIIDEGAQKAEGLIIHLAGFEEREQIQVPAIWYITNCHRLDPVQGYTDISKDFGVSEELWQTGYIGASTPQNIRNFLEQKASEFSPFWFHQGFDLGVFNTLNYFLNESFRLLIQSRPNNLSFPTSLEEWSKHLSMSILTYGAYFQSFFGPSEQYVGGGVDIVSLPWPD